MREFVNQVIDRLPRLSDDQVRQVLKAVASEQNMLSAVIDSLPTGIVILDTNWYVKTTNKAADRFLFSGGLDENSLEKDPIWHFVVEKEICDFIKNCAKSERGNVTEEFTVATSDGSARFLTVTIFPYADQSEICGYIILIEDITQKRTKEVLVRRMENMAGLTNLAAGMAHEIKNPLGAISIHIQLIQRALKKAREKEGLLPEKKFLEDHLDVVTEEIDGLNKLVMDFLFAVRPVKANLMLSDVGKILSNIVDFFTPEFNRSKVKMELSLAEKPTRVLIDEKLFREVIINISQNAFAAIKSQFPECAEPDPDSSIMPGVVEFTTTVKNEKLYLTITDNGCGMDDQTVSRIFEPYFTTKANGTGLGMTMAYKIIKEFNGDIQVSSKLGKGTSFTITIPIPQTETKLLSGGSK